ncbi:MAG TPA: hypothetical protein DDW93_03280 [Firmicutes bacterium]|nr:hypothetical protein [Bacillota bacterium]
MYIRDILGHTSVQVTGIYARTDSRPQKISFYARWFLRNLPWLESLLKNVFPRIKLRETIGRKCNCDRQEGKFRKSRTWDCSNVRCLLDVFDFYSKYIKNYPNT